MTIRKPAARPAVPHFSSGPCAKRPGWSLQTLTDALLGRSHRSKAGRAKLEIGLAKGKKQHDKRHSEKDRDWQRDKGRIMKAMRR